MSNDFLRRSRSVLAIALACAGLPAVAQTAPAVGLIDRLGGEVGASAASGAVFQPYAYTRVHDGDVFTLAPGAELRIVSFAARIREDWKGPARLREGSGGGQALSGAPPLRTPIAGVPARVDLGAVGNVEQIGGVNLRGPSDVPDAAAIAQAAADYRAWAATAAPDDVLPEIYMTGFLEPLQRPELLQPYVKIMLAKQPDNADVQALARQVGLAP
jgi:hypothetical protein